MIYFCREYEYQIFVPIVQFFSLDQSGGTQTNIIYHQPYNHASSIKVLHLVDEQIQNKITVATSIRLACRVVNWTQALSAGQE